MRLNDHGGPFKNADDAIKIQGKTRCFWGGNHIKIMTKRKRKKIMEGGGGGGCCGSDVGVRVGDTRRDGERTDGLTKALIK